MSIIEEALRRVNDPAIPQEAKATATTSRPPAPRPATPYLDPLKPSPLAASSATPRALFMVVAAILGCTILLLIGGTAWLLRTINAQAPTSASTAASSSRSAPLSPALDATPRPHPSVPSPSVPAAGDAQAAPRFIVSGVVEGGGTSYAVINGQIVSVGEFIEGATLMEVDGSTVRLRPANGSDIYVRVPR